MNRVTTLQTPLAEAERFRLFVTGVSDYAIYMLTPTGHVHTWNAGAQRFKGYTADEIIGQHFSRFYTDFDRANGKPSRALQTALETGKFEDEGWRVRKDGSQFWASVVIDPIFDDNRNLIGFAKVTRDITEKKRVQEELRASEERFRLLVQSVSDYAIYMLSPTGIVTNWNVGAERIKGYLAEEVVGTHFSRFYTDEDRTSELPARALRTAAAEGRFEHEGWRVRKDGSRFWANVVIAPVRGETGTLLGFAKITRDMTERRLASQALEQAKEALFHSQKLEAIGKLTGGVAHDFNNLLAVMVNGLELLSGRLQNPLDRKIIDSMQHAAERGAKLTQQLLTFARQQPLNLQNADINRIILAFEAVLRRVGAEGLPLSLHLAPSLWLTKVDVTQFEAALLNLVSNAHDAMPGGGTVTISTANVMLKEHQAGNLPAGNYVRIAVRDTGEGMPASVLSRAIEPFFTTKELGKGTGLGLSQVFGTVQQANGDLVIESQVGQGTCVSLYLPAIAMSTDAKGGMVPGVQHETEKVLVVDDQADVLDMTVELFNHLGYEVLAAQDGNTALDILRRTPDIKILFTDVRMPGMSGVELAREARKLLPKLAVVLASGYASTALQSEAAALREYPFLNKPYRLADLARILRRATAV